MPARTLNEKITRFECIRCKTPAPVDDHLEGCKNCGEDGHAAAMRPVYSGLEYRVAADGCGRSNFANWLSYPDHIDLGQGETPVVEVRALAETLNIAKLSIKLEGANPTGSHKDRMSAITTARAVDIGAKTVVAASSGNAGASVAAYAAAVGLECIVVTTPKMNPNWRRAIEMHGAQLVATETVEGRWALVADRVKSGEWYPATNYVTPAVGSNPFGIDGYRSIAFELYEQYGSNQPTDIIVPTSRADLLWGITRGYQDLVESSLIGCSPKVHAVEPFPRLSSVLEGADYRGIFPGTSKMVSLGGSTVTYQALDALKMSGGTAVTTFEPEVLADQKLLAKAGLYMECSCAAALTGIRSLRTSGQINAASSVLMIATSHGYKEYQNYGDLIETYSI